MIKGLMYIKCLEECLDIRSSKFAAAVIIVVAIFNYCKENISTDKFSSLASSLVTLEFVQREKV